MKAKLAVLTGCVGLLAAALPVLAHHSFAAEYDNSKPVSVKGKLVRMDWVNPHSHVVLEVTKEDGKTEQWVAETPPPNGLYRAGWRSEWHQRGAAVPANGALRKDGTTLLCAGHRV